MVSTKGRLRGEQVGPVRGASGAWGITCIARLTCVLASDAWMGTKLNAWGPPFIYFVSH